MPRTPAALALVVSGSVALADTPAPAGSGLAPVSQPALYYEVAGTGPALVLIHGGQLDRRMWDDEFALLARSFRVVRYDVRGYGLSPSPQAVYSHAADLAALLDHLRIERPHLVGLSLGAMIAVDFALERPERVASLVLAAPGLAGISSTSEEDARYFAYVDAAQSGRQAAAELWLRDPLMVPAMEQPGLAERLRGLARDNAHCWLNNPLLRRIPQPPAARRLAEVRSATLVVVGDRDTPRILDNADRLAAGIPGARKRVIPGAGHMVNLERPAEFRSAVTTFLAGPFSGEGEERR